MVTINADLRRERARCSFDPTELTNLWDGSKEKTAHRHELGKSSDPAAIYNSHALIVASSLPPPPPHGAIISRTPPLLFLGRPLSLSAALAGMPRARNVDAQIARPLIALFISYYSSLSDKTPGPSATVYSVEGSDLHYAYPRAPI